VTHRGLEADASRQLERAEESELSVALYGGAGRLRGDASRPLPRNASATEA